LSAGEFLYLFCTFCHTFLEFLVDENFFAFLEMFTWEFLYNAVFLTFPSTNVFAFSARFNTFGFARTDLLSSAHDVFTAFETKSLSRTAFLSASTFHLFN